MKIAVLSDIHGNLPALQTAVADIDAWNPDKVVVNGDIVNRGPLSLDCLRLIRQRHETDGWHLVRGNHEDYLLECAQPDSPQSGPKYELMQFAHWAYNQLNGDVAALAAMPEQFQWVAPDGSEFRVVHASMKSRRWGIYYKQPIEEQRELIAPPPAVFVTGHTHLPHIHTVDETLVVNAGSVGASFDLDHRLSYGRFTWDETNGWQAEIIRLEYDQAQVEKDYVESGFLAEAGALAQLMLVELRKARGLIYRWAHKYEKAVLAGEIDIESSVRELMAEEDVRPFTGPPGWTIP